MLAEHQQECHTKSDSHCGPGGTLRSGHGLALDLNFSVTAEDRLQA